VLSFIGTAAGQRLVRNAETLDATKIRAWLEAARGVRAA
jgi:hypothetical protein